MRMDRFSPPAHGSYVLRNARVPASLAPGLALRNHCRASGLATTDLQIVGGCFAAPVDGAASHDVDLRGRLVLPGFVDMHVHLDKAFTVRRTGMPVGSLRDAVKLSMDDAVNRTADDLRCRMTFALRCAYAHGTLAMRTHLDSPDMPHESIAWRIFEDIRSEWSGLIDLQAVALMAVERVDDGDFNERCAQISQRGGIAGAFVAPGAASRKRLERFLAICENNGLDADFHVDETLDAAADGLAHIAEAALSTGYGGRIVVGHCCALASKPEAEASIILDRVAQAGLHVVSLPLTNMFLMDRRDGKTPIRRGLTLVREMQARGIPVSFASDNVCDAFFPHGDFDMLEVLRSAIRAAHLENELAGWIDAAFARPANAMSLDTKGRFRIGASADAIIFQARDWIELFSRPQAGRHVIRGGSLIGVEPPDFEDMAMLGAVR